MKLSRQAVLLAAGLVASSVTACRVVRVHSSQHRWLDYSLDLSDEMLNDHPTYSDGERHLYFFNGNESDEPGSGRWILGKDFGSEEGWVFAPSYAPAPHLVHDDSMNDGMSPWYVQTLGEGWRRDDTLTFTCMSETAECIVSSAELPEASGIYVEIARSHGHKDAPVYFNAFSSLYMYADNVDKDSSISSSDESVVKDTSLPHTMAPSSLPLSSSSKKDMTRWVISGGEYLNPFFDRPLAVVEVNSNDKATLYDLDVDGKYGSSSSSSYDNNDVMWRVHKVLEQSIDEEDEEKDLEGFSVSLRNTKMVERFVDAPQTEVVCYRKGVSARNRFIKHLNERRGAVLSEPNPSSTSSSSLDGPKSLKLRSGLRMPIAGIGAGAISDDAEEVLVGVCGQKGNGMRLIDTASAYKNEDRIGQLLADGIECPDLTPVIAIDAMSDEEVGGGDEERQRLRAEAVEGLQRYPAVYRDDVFVTSKVWPTELGYMETLAAVERSLQQLRTWYLDSYLIHWPECRNDVQWMNCDQTINKAGTWQDSYRAMQRLYQEGVLLSLGVSNFSPQALDETLVAHLSHRLSDQTAVSRSQPSVPHVIQNFADVFVRERGVMEVAKKHDIVFQAYSPLRRLVLENEALMGAAGEFEENVLAQLSSSSEEEESAAALDLANMSLYEKGAAAPDLGDGRSSLYRRHMPTLQLISQGVQKSPHEVALRFMVQRHDEKIAVLTRSSNPAHVVRNKRALEGMSVPDEPVSQDARVWRLENEHMSVLHINGEGIEGDEYVSREVEVEVSEEGEEREEL